MGQGAVCASVEEIEALERLGCDVQLGMALYTGKVSLDKAFAACIDWKKLEASRRSVRSDVDFVVTFEEMQAMFDAKGIDLSSYEAESSFHDATLAGLGYGCDVGVDASIE